MHTAPTTPAQGPLQLEKAYPPAKAPWDIVDRTATLRLHLGEPEKARALWKGATSAPGPAVRDARIGAAYLDEGQFEAARKAYERAGFEQSDTFATIMF